MPNAQLFQTNRGKQVPPADTKNEAGGVAYALSPRAALAQLAATGCLNDTFYADASEQLDKVLELAAQCEPAFVAKVAVYARERGYMKDMPALLLAYLCSKKETKLAGRIFNTVVDGPKMLRTFVQIVRSGQTGRKSFGTAPKRFIQNWFASRNATQLFRQSIGANPSIPDIIKMAHPKPTDAAQRAVLGYLIGKKFDLEALPKLAQQYLDWQTKPSLDVPDVPWEMLTNQKLPDEVWAAIAERCTWTQLRMNLNNFQRHNVFRDGPRLERLATKLANGEAVAKAKVMPYQLLAAFMNASDDVPMAMKLALQDAMEHATKNVPKFPGKVYILPDVSGSMQSPVTGNRGNATSKVRCVDVAALFSACVLRVNPLAEVLPFDQQLYRLSPNPRDSVMTIAKELAACGGGGTDCHLPLQYLVEHKAKGDAVIYLSDSESWLDSSGAGRNGTATMRAWTAFKVLNPNAKMVCIDMQPYATVQVPPGGDTLHVGGFSDVVWDVVASFLEAETNWVDKIEAVELG